MKRAICLQGRIKGLENFPGDRIGPYRANRVPYKGARSYLVDKIVLRRLRE